MQKSPRREDSFVGLFIIVAQINSQKLSIWLVQPFLIDFETPVAIEYRTIELGLIALLSWVGGNVTMQMYFSYNLAARAAVEDVTGATRCLPNE